MAHNEKLKQARLQKKWTLERASEKVGVHISTYNKWELGKQEPHLTTLELVCEAFGASAEDLGFYERVYEKQPRPELYTMNDQFLLSENVTQENEAMLYDTLEVMILSRILMWKHQHGQYTLLQANVQREIRRFDSMVHFQQSHEVQISRRQALRTIVKLPIGMFGLTALDNIKHLPIEEILSSCAAGLVACKVLYNSGEVEVVSHTLTKYLSMLTPLSTYSSSHQKQVANIIGQTYLLMTLIADHRRDYTMMELYCLEAQKYAQIAEDVNLEAATLLRLAVKHDYESRWRKTLQTYQSVIPFLPQISPLLQTRVYLGLAGAYGYCREQENARKMLDIAQNMFPAKPEEDAYFLSAFTNTHTLSLWTGLVQKYTNQYDEALDTFSNIGHLQYQEGVPECNRIEFVNYTASIAIRQRDLEKSCTYLENAGSAALAIGHQQRYVETCDTYKEMRVMWRDEPKVLSLQELFSQR